MERWPQRLVFVWAAGVLAFLYCLLAGWGVPAQRTFFMLAAAAVGLSGRVPLSGTQAVLGAAVAMTALDPWSVLSTGFWLSFGAMVILVLMAQQVGLTSWSPESRWQALWQALRAGAHLQWVMTLAITPVTVYLFQQVSVSGLLANAWAIPWVTFAATPLALLTAGLCLLPIPDGWLTHLAWLAHATLWLSLAPVRWLAQFDWLSFEVHAIGVWELSLGVIGVACALCLPPWRGRWLAWLLLLPTLTTTPSKPDWGHWRLTAFDVGQGAAILIQTRSHALLFDTGWRYGQADAVQRVILPELKAMGVKRLDQVVISHPDIDHVGGLERLLQTRSVVQLIGSGLARNDVVACQAPQSWSVDGVQFEFLHPSDDCATKLLKGLARNRCSCVLLVSGHAHRALLTGDIDSTVEQTLIGKLALPIDVALVAHHGSRSSSHPDWVSHIRAANAVIQAGAYNRYGHPHPEVFKRWRLAGSVVWDSIGHGAISFESSARGLAVLSARAQRQRYWHDVQLTPLDLE
jgi:competence protein ComEC